jgi:hypothetical protein
MRAMTAAQDAALSSKHRSVYARMFVDRGASDWVNLSNLEGRDWLKGFVCGETVDTPGLTATISLHLQVEGLSLATLRTTSKLNASGVLIDIGHPIYIETATMPEGVAPAAGDWVEAFRGEIDEVEWEASPMVLRCRDKGGALDRFIETQVKYPADPASDDAVENVMQAILDDHIGGVTLYSITGTGGTPFQSADSPGWNIAEYIQKKQTINAALEVLARQIGYQVRYRWNASTGAFQLTFFEPGRQLAARGELTLIGQPLNNETFDVNLTTFTAKTSGAGADEFNIGTTIDDTLDNIVAMLNTGSEAANLIAWKAYRAHASGTITFTGQPSNNDTLVIDSTTYTAKTTADPAVVTEFEIGANVATTIQHLAYSVALQMNRVQAYGGGLGSVETEGVTPTTLRIGATAAGIAGNSIVFTESMSNVTMDGGGTLGGTRAGREDGVIIQWLTKGSVGNGITFGESMTNATANGSGSLGGTRAGTDLAVDRTFTADEYYKLNKLSISRAGIRNVVRVQYGQRPEDRTSVEVDDSASIAKYGRRFMEVAEASTSQIDSLTEARSMADAILDDLKEPTADHVAEQPYFWPVELGDYYTYAANGVHYDSDQSLAVVGYQHVFQDGRTRTIISTRGTPSGGADAWLSLEARDGVGPQNDFYIDAQPTNAVGIPGMGSLTVVYDDPRGGNPPVPDWVLTECHVSTSDGFTPDETTLADLGRTTLFKIDGLTPGVTYFVKLIAVDSSGNRSNAGHQVRVATQTVGAYHENPDAQKRNLCPNGEFGQATLPIATNAPDGWTVVTDAWGTDFLEETTIAQTGGRSIKMPDSVTTGYQESAYIPVSLDVLYRIEWRVRSTNTTVRATITVEAFDKDKASLGTQALSNPSLGATDTWQTFSDWLYPRDISDSARFFKIRVSRNAGSSQTVYVDYLMVTRGGPSAEAYHTSGQAISAATVTPINLNAVDFEQGDIVISATQYGIDLGNGYFRCLVPGQYVVQGGVTAESLQTGDTLEVGVRVNSTQVKTGVALVIGANGDHELTCAAVLDLSKDDLVEIYILSSRATTTAGGRLKQYLHIAMNEAGQ